MVTLDRRTLLGGSRGSGSVRVRAPPAQRGSPCSITASRPDDARARRAAGRDRRGRRLVAVGRRAAAAGRCRRSRYRPEMNLEVLAAVKPDLVLSTPYLDTARAADRADRAARLAADLHRGEGTAASLHRGGAADRGADRAQRGGRDAHRDGRGALRGAAGAVRRHAAEPFLLVNFVDARHVRV